MGCIRNTDNILVEKPEGKRQLGRPRRSRGGNIRMNLRETRKEDVYWMCLVQDRDQ
jgi:hypothetical protein